MPPLLRAFEQTQLLGRLLDVLETADRAFRGRSEAEADVALFEGMSLLGELFGSLDPVASPEASAHLGDVCDACLRALGDAYAGSPDALVAATSLVRAMHAALVPAEPRARAAA